MGLNILIVGGGLGGFAAAAYLRKNHNVTVLERNQLDFSRNDYAIGVICNAYNLLQKIGIKDENLDMTIMVKTWTRTAQNEPIYTRDFDTRKTYGTPSILLRRSKLHKELHRLATSPELDGKPAKVIENFRVTKIDCETATAYSEDGRSSSADLLIGADGINSVVRSAVLSDDGTGSREAPAVTHDLIAFMKTIPASAFAAIPELSWFGDPVNEGGLASWAAPEDPFAKPGLVFTKRRLLAAHMSPTEAGIIGYTTEQEFGPQFDNMKTSIIKGVAASRATTEFQGFYQPLVDLFEVSSDGKADVWRIRDIDPVDRWYRGKAVLLGDAVHAVTPHAGQGCNMAVEDAEALGFLLRTAKTAEDVQAAFPLFTKVRKDRVQYTAKASRQMGALLPKEEMERLGEFDRAEFGKKTYGYVGAEAALKDAGVQE